MRLISTWRSTMSDLVERLREHGWSLPERHPTADILREAADALEAAEARIAEVERQRDIAVDDAYNKPQNPDFGKHE
jgi:hypothetical protein